MPANSVESLQSNLDNLKALEGIFSDLLELKEHSNTLYDKKYYKEAAQGFKTILETAR
jgi:hypothetical protein